MITTRPGKSKKPFDIYNQNFEDYVTAMVNDMTDAQREALPLVITRKAFVHGGNFKASKLSFGELAYLVTTFNKRIVILVDGDDDESTATIDTLKDALLVQKRKKPLHEVGDKMITDGMFVLGDREMMDATVALRLLNHTQLWSHLFEQAKKLKKGKLTGYKNQRAVFRTMVGLLAKYESIKGDLIGVFGISFPEWCALMFFVDGEKAPGEFYKMFNHTPGAFLKTKKRAVSRLARAGYLLSRGQARSQVYSLTAKGDELLSKIMEKVFVQHAKTVKVK